MDLERRTLLVTVALQAVRGTLQLVPLKTMRSSRTLPLPGVVGAVLEAQRVQQVEERLLAGARWQEHGRVFTTRVGTPIHPRNLVRLFHALLRRAGLPAVRFHNLRQYVPACLPHTACPRGSRWTFLGIPILGSPKTFTRTCSTRLNNKRRTSWIGCSTKGARVG